MDFPGGHAERMFVGGVASPQALDQGRGRLTAPDHVLLPLLLLDLQGESAAQNPLERKLPLFVRFSGGKGQLILTAGRAKKLMPNNAQKLAMSFPCQVMGTVSPYPTVQRVMTPHQRASAKLLKFFGLASFSAKYTKNDANISPRKPM